MGLDEEILADAKRQGFEQGFKEGFRQGVEKAQKEIIKRLLTKGFSTEKIQDLLELPLELILLSKDELENKLF